MTTAPNAAPKNIAATDASLLANLGLLPFASEESAPMPVIVSVRTVVVRSGIASFRDSGIPCAHRECCQGDQSKRLKRMFEQIGSVSDAAKRRSQQKSHLQEERLCRKSNL